MKLQKLFLPSLIFAFSLSGYSIAQVEQDLDVFSGTPYVQRTAGLGRGVNFGNMLEAPNEGDWGLFVEEMFFDRVVEAGMHHVRIPISWTHHADLESPFTIDPVFFDRIDWVVDQALQRGLKVIVNVHHYDALNESPINERDRAFAIWQQIAAQYQNESIEEVFFEILNEPHGTFSIHPAIWNDFASEALQVIRQTNPDRKVLVGPVNYNSISSLDSFDPPDDPNLIGTVHYYEPFSFTHQGAEWVTPTPPTGVTWEGSTFGLANPWQNWSWDTTTSSTEQGIEVTHNVGYSGFQLHNPTAIENAQTLSVTCDGPINLTIGIRNHFTGAEAFFPLATNANQQTYAVDISSFGDNNAVTNIFLQNDSPDPQPPYTVTQFRLTAENGTSPLIDSADQRIKNAFGAASLWGLENRMPMHLGEFGAYRFGDLDSRVRWTTAVRESAELFKIDWSYWELAAGFGFYDPEAEQFRLPLLQALVPVSK